MLEEKEKKDLTIFDGFPYDFPSLKQLITSIGEPKFVINLNVTKEAALKLYCKKYDIEIDPEKEKGMSEEE